MDCDRCHGERAVLHVTSLENGKKREAHICQKCANAVGNININFTIGQMLGEPAKRRTAASSRGKRCPYCGSSWAEIAKRYRLGCPFDYEFFAEELTKVVEDYHKSSSHKGKVPSRADDRVKKEKRINDLNLVLADLVKQEKYEKAAEVRDEIRRLEKDLSS